MLIPTSGGNSNKAPSAPTQLQHNMSASRPPSPSPSQLPPIPGSPSYSYASTANPLGSTFNLPLPPPPRPAHAVLSKSDLEASQSTYADLLSTAKAYRTALATLSSAASAFGSALEGCARLKEARSPSVQPGRNGTSTNARSVEGSVSNLQNNGSARRFDLNGEGNGEETCSADSLLAASGLHHLFANHSQILSETVYRSFEVPLLHDFDTWTDAIENESLAYASSTKNLSKEIQYMEKEGLKLHKQRKRDVNKFRNHLVALTGKLDAMTELHGRHARELLRETQDVSNRVVEAVGSLSRAEVEIFDCLARKGWAGGGLDDLLEKGSDIFGEEAVNTLDHSVQDGGAGADGKKIFSVLPQKSILAASAVVDGDSVSATGMAHKRTDSLVIEGDRMYQSLGAVVDHDTRSIFSTESEFNKSRGVRPFSPPPVERIEEEVSRGKSGLARKVSEGEDSVETVVRSGEGKAGSEDERGRERRWSVTDEDSSD